MSEPPAKTRWNQSHNRAAKKKKTALSEPNDSPANAMKYVLNPRRPHQQALNWSASMFSPAAARVTLS
jgi:hypothetical protein